MKVFIFAVTVFLSAFAQANDGSFIYVDVLGVNPKTILPLAETGKSVQVYGKQVWRFAELLPYAPIHEANHISFTSNGWNLSIWCPKYYTRPTDGLQYDDIMCEFYINRFSLVELQEIKEFSDSEQIFDIPGSTSSGSYPVTGINPNGAAKGVLFEVYGDDAVVLNDMIEGGTLKLKSNAYSFSISCVKDYQRPAGNFEFRSDYMCTFRLQ